MTHAEPADTDRLIARLGAQAHTAWQLGSPLYAELLSRIQDDVVDRGPCFGVLDTYAHEADGKAVPLRFLAAVHRLVLRRRAPALALYYPSVGGTAPITGVWEVFRNVVEEHTTVLRELTGLPCQTNEVGRSAALAPAFMWLSAQYPGRPLHHYEIGSSAGLNLQWDRFCYGTADKSVQWGRIDSPVDLRGHWVDAPPDLPSKVDIGSRQGCDPAPGDPRDAGTRESLTASIWADQQARHQRLKGALHLATDRPAPVATATAGEWLDMELPARPEGMAVVFHSVVWRYIAEDERGRIQRVMAREGAAATIGSPLAWVRLEPIPPKMTYDGTPYPVTVTTWPGGSTRVIGTAHAHGQEFRWQDA